MGKDLKGKELGTGISQRKDGLYVARYTDRFGRRQSPMYAKTEREIKKKYRDAKYEDEHNIAIKGAKVTLDQWYETWLETYAPESLKQHTILGYMNSYKNHIRPVFGHMIIQDITPLMIKQWATKIRDAGAKSAQNYLVAFKSILRDAQVAGLIQSNPAGNVSIRSNCVSQKTIALTQKQLELFFENFKCNPNKAGTDWLLVIKFLVLTGYRFGEMASLRWSDIDWENQCMYVRRTLHMKYDNGAEAYFTTPKSNNSMRRTPLTDEIVSILRRACQLQEEWRKQFPGDWANQTESSRDLVFTYKYGTHLQNAAFNKMLHMHIKKRNAQLPPDQHIPPITAHSFRDTCASLCYKEGMPIKEIQELLGHGEQVMTLYYIQPDPEDFKNRLQTLHSQIDTRLES